MILGTLLVQGLTLPPLIHLLDVDDADEQLEREESKARLLAVEGRARAARRAGDRGVGARGHGRAGPPLLRLPAPAVRISRFDDEADSDGYEERSEAYQRLVREVLDAQRVTLQALRDAGKINDEVMRRIERELDLEDSRLEI